MVAQCRQRLRAGRRLDHAIVVRRRAWCAAAGGSAARRRRPGWSRRRHRSRPFGFGIAERRTRPRGGRRGWRRRWCRPGPRRSPWRWQARARCRRCWRSPARRGRTCRRAGSSASAGMPGPSSRTTISTRSPHAPRLDSIRRRPAEYFAALSSRLNRTCSTSTKSSGSSGRSGAIDLRHDAVLQQRRGAAQRRRRRGRRHRPARAGLDGAGIEPGHVEQVADEAVEPLGLAQRRRQQLVARVPRRRARDGSRRLESAPMIEASGVRRSCDTEVSRAERSRSRSALRRASSMSSARVQALDGDRRLVDQRIEQPALGGVSSAPFLRRQDADHADRRAAGADRHEQPARAGQGVGAAAGRVVVLPGPARRGEVGIARARSSGGKAARGTSGPSSGFGHQDDDLGVQQAGELVATTHSRSSRSATPAILRLKA